MTKLARLAKNILIVHFYQSCIFYCVHEGNIELEVCAVKVFPRVAKTEQCIELVSSTIGANIYKYTDGAI
jgi:hypothetical protein